MDHNKKPVFWKNIPFHPFLFVIYPLLFLVAHNDLNFWDGGPVLLVICLATALLFGAILYFFLRDVKRAALILSFWILLFFWTIPFCDFVSTLAPIKIGKSTPCYFLLFYPIGTYFLWRRKSGFQVSTLLLNTVSTVLVALALGEMGWNAFVVAKNDHASSQRKSSENSSTFSETEKDSTGCPDIYYIVCDAYAGRDALEKIHRFDNTSFLSDLEKRGFQVVRYSSSNYCETKLTIPSVLNMNYIDQILTQEELNVKKQFKLKRIMFPYLLDNELIQYLRPLGYRYVFVMNSFWKLHVDMKKQPEFMVSSTVNGEFLSLFYNSTLLCILYQLNFYQELQRRETLNTLELLKNMPEKYGPEPFLAYVHFFPPQSPYSFQADGTKQRFYYHAGLSPQTENEMYLEQVQFINDALLKAIDSILLQSKREPIIVLMSDHGSRLTTDYSPLYECSEKEALTFYNNLITFRLPNGVRLDNTDEMTNVNVFRAILNAVFNENHSMLEPRYWGRRGQDNDREITQEILPVFKKLKAESPSGADDNSRQVGFHGMP